MITNKNQWYQKRNLRTSSFIDDSSALDNFHVGIILPENINENRILKLTELTLNILSRWCSNISIDNPYPEINEHLLKLLKINDPYISVTFNSIKSFKSHINVFISPRQITDMDHDYISIDGKGWLSCCSFNKTTSLPESKSQNDIIGISFAACLVNAELFRYSIHKPCVPYTKWYSVWNLECYDYQPVKDDGQDWVQYDLGNINLIGCGAIGSSFVYLFPFTGLKANFLLIDPDPLEIHNTSSSLLFSADAAIKGELKVLQNKQWLNQYDINAEIFPHYYNNLSNSNCDLVCCFANEKDIWASLQNNYPPLTFHATTSKNWSVNIGRHIPLIDECIACTFKDIIKTEFVPICGGVELPTINTETETHTAILPYLAPVAAVICLAQIIKTVSGKIEKAGVTNFSMLTPNGSFIEDITKFGNCTICESQEVLYKKSFGKKSKFWALSLR
ncbi:MAG: hypothetical protein J0I09_10495 [Sphingobacteriia bacterium]|nr:hypothetical protein [Sphingobacteriia bacterium]